MTIAGNVYFGLKVTRVWMQSVSKTAKLRVCTGQAVLCEQTLSKGNVSIRTWSSPFADQNYVGEVLWEIKAMA